MIPDGARVRAIISEEFRRILSAGEGDVWGEVVAYSFDRYLIEFDRPLAIYFKLKDRETERRRWVHSGSVVRASLLDLVAQAAL